MVERINNWFTLEPAVSMLMITTAIVLFGSAFKSYKETSGNFTQHMEVFRTSAGNHTFTYHRFN